MTVAISEIVTTRAQLIFSLTSILSVESSGNKLGGGFDEMGPKSVIKSNLGLLSLAMSLPINKAVLTFILTSYTLSQN